MFRINGYNENQYKRIVTRAMVENKRIVKRDDNYEGKRIFLPYIKGTMDMLAKKLKRKNFRVIFTPLNTIRNMVDSLKDLIDPGAYKGVYSIPYSCGKEYIGETGQSMKTRFKEHSDDIRHDRHKNSALEKHSHLTKHQICLEKASVLTKEESLTKQKVRDKIEINVALLAVSNNPFIFH